MHRSKALILSVTRSVGLSAALLGAAALLAGCAGTTTLMPTPTIYRGAVAKPLFGRPDAEAPVAPIDLLYITDRAPETMAGTPLSYGSDRSRSMAFGSVSVEIGAKVTWPILIEESTASERKVRLDLQLGTTVELGRFPPIPYEVDQTPSGNIRDPAVLEVHAKAAAGLQAEVARRIAISPRKEVVLFVHGYANTFEDSAFTMTNFCHFLGREFVCAIFSWPAGGSRGLMAGYHVDRESGEFAAHHLKQAIRLISQTPGVECIHLMAHSRGTDVLVTALQELNIESYSNGTSIGGRFKLKDVVILAPDIDADVAVAKVFSVASDPDLPYEGAPKPSVLPGPGLRITVYVSRSDKALTLSQFLFGSLLRVGRLDVALLTKEQAENASRLAYAVDFIQVKGPGFLGHSYFVSDPAVSSDLIALIRYGLKPGEPGRPLEEIQAPFWRIPAGS